MHRSKSRFRVRFRLWTVNPATVVLRKPKSDRIKFRTRIKKKKQNRYPRAIQKTERQCAYGNRNRTRRKTILNPFVETRSRGFFFFGAVGRKRTKRTEVKRVWIFEITKKKKYTNDLSYPTRDDPTRDVFAAKLLKIRPYNILYESHSKGLDDGIEKRLNCFFERTTTRDTIYITISWSK